MKTLRRLYRAFCLSCLTALVFASTAFADNGIPNVKPASSDSYPGHEQVNKALSLFLLGIVLVLLLTALGSLVGIIRSLRDEREGFSKGAGGAFLLSVIFIAIITTQGTAFISSWGAYF